MLSNSYLGQISYPTAKNHNCGVSGTIQSGKDQYYSTEQKDIIPVMTMSDTKTGGGGQGRTKRSPIDQNDNRIKRQQKLNKHGDNSKRP